MSEESTSSRCPECGAPLEGARVCRDYFHEVLALEARVPGGPGAEPHFLAVASYNLQHPSGFVVSMLVGLHDTLADVLAGRADVAEARRRARQATDGATRVTRRPEEVPSDDERALLTDWPSAWAMTVRDVAGVAPDRYVAQVRAWATSVAAALDTVRRPAGSASAPRRLTQTHPATRSARAR